MGVKDFYRWLEHAGYVPDTEEFVYSSSRLIVDTKSLMYRFGYGVAIDKTTEEFCNTVAALIQDFFEQFEHVTFVNDGQIDNSHPKFLTSLQRSQQLEQSRKRAHDMSAQLAQELLENGTNQDEKLERLDKLERAARGVSFEKSKMILKILEHAHPNFQCVQCDAEADDYILLHHNEYDYVISEDSDFIVGGVNKLLRGIGTKKQGIYKIQDILQKLQLTLLQLQEIASIAGNDYTMKGIENMGLAKAYPLIQKYGSCQTMLFKWTPKERGRAVVSPLFFERFNLSMNVYQKTTDVIYLHEPIKLHIQDDDDDEKKAKKTPLEQPIQEFYSIFKKQKKIN